MKSLSASILADTIVAAMKAAPPLPVDPEDIPEGASEDTLDYWLQLAKRNGAAADTDGDLQALAQMGRLSASLLEAKRKSAPLPVVDPNENPDFVALAKAFRTRMAKMLEPPT